MAAELWMLRHAEAVDEAPSGRDADRALTKRGAEQARVAGAALASLGVEFAVVYTSPKVRALDTARLACEAIGVAEPIVAASLEAGFSVADALTLVQSTEGNRILVVGHDPDFTQVVLDITGARVQFKKGGVAVIAVRDRELLALLRPRELRRIA